MLSIGISCGRLCRQAHIMKNAKISFGASTGGVPSRWSFVSKRPSAFQHDRCFASNSHEKREDDSFFVRQRQRTEAWKDRADQVRSNAAHHYQEFRQHPGASARAGAHSIGELIRQYGPVAIGTYFSIYLTTLATLFVGVESGVLDPISLFEMLGQVQDPSETKNTVDFVVDFMRKYRLTAGYADVVLRYPSFANLGVAWIAVKFTEPIRLAATIAITPRVARFLGSNNNETAPVKGEESLSDDDASNAENQGNSSSRK